MNLEPERDATAVLFADISGSVTLYEDRGDTVGFALNDKCLTIVEGNVTTQGGRVIKRAGDAVLAAFDSAGSAVRAAAEMMKQVEAPGSALHVEGVTDFREAVERGALERLVPILMTAMAAGLALIPLAVRSGQSGSEIQTPMAIVILCGLTTSTLLNMFVVPTLYLRFGSRMRAAETGIDEIAGSRRRDDLPR